MKKLKFLLLAFFAASMFFVACDKNKSGDDPEPGPEPSTFPADSGVVGPHSYKWWFDENGIYINVIIDADTAAASGAWEVFSFENLNPDLVSEHIMKNVSETDFTNFYPVEPDGSVLEDWTSYRPGQWVDQDGNGVGYSDGVFFWQYQVYQDKGEYYDYAIPGLVLIGQNPDNTPASGTTIVSKAKICDMDWIVTAKYIGDYDPGTKPKYDDDTPGATTPSGKGFLKATDFTTITPHIFEYDFSSTAINVTATISLADTDPEAYALGYFKIDPSVLSDIIGKNVEETTIEEFYPIEPDGTQGTSWSSYAPGQWLALDGSSAAWDTGKAFWQYHIYGESQGQGYDFKAPGAFVIGQGPSNLPVAGDVVVSKASLCGIPMTVTIKFVEAIVPGGGDASGEGHLLALENASETAHTYKYDFSTEGFNTEVTISLAAAGDAWGLGYFVVDMAVVDGIIGTSVAETTLETFYPVEPDGTSGADWTSYKPGQWVNVDGTAGDWSANYCFWQYHAYADKGEFYDIAVPGALLVGQAPGAPTAGTTVVSKAKLCGIDWVVTFKFVE